MAKVEWKQAFAVAKKLHDGGIYKQMKNEQYARTPTDEYPFRKKSRGRFSPVSAEQKEEWRQLADKGGKI